jgi:hypothetical protein
MSKCLKCGKESSHFYDWHTGTIIDKQTAQTTDWSQFKTTTTTTTKYNNVVRHGDYLCTKCAWNTWLFHSRFEHTYIGPLGFALLIALVAAIAYLMGERGGVLALPWLVVIVFVYIGIVLLSGLYILLSSIFDWAVPSSVGQKALASMNTQYSNGTRFFWSDPR